MISGSRSEAAERRSKGRNRDTSSVDDDDTEMRDDDDDKDRDLRELTRWMRSWIWWRSLSTAEAAAAEMVVSEAVAAEAGSVRAWIWVRIVGYSFI